MYRFRKSIYRECGYNPDWSEWPDTVDGREIDEQGCLVNPRSEFESLLRFKKEWCEECSE